MDLRLSIELASSVWFPQEAVRIDLAVEPTGPLAVRFVAPPPDACVDVELHGPDASLAHLRCRPLPPIVPSGDEIELEPDESFAIALVLPADATPRPGTYRLTASIEIGGTRLVAGPVELVRDVVRRSQVVVGRARGQATALGSSCYQMCWGDHAALILRASLGWSDDWPATAMSEAHDERIAIVPTDASAPATLGDRDGDAEWLAWTFGGAGEPRLAVASRHGGFVPSAYPLARPGRVVRDVLPAGDGCDVVVLDATGVHLDVLRVDDGGVRPSWSAELPSATGTVMVARGTGEHRRRTAIAAATDSPHGVLLHFAVAIDEEPPARFDSVLVPDAAIIDPSALAVALDRRGNGHVVLLARELVGDANALVLARIGFAPDATPRLDHSAIARRVIDLPCPPVAAAVSLHIDEERSLWSFDWLALLADGRCAASRRIDVPWVFTPAHAPSRPLCLSSFAERALFAASDTSGARRFLDLG